MIGNNTDIRKPIKLRNTLYLNLRHFVELDKYYLIKKEANKIVITEFNPLKL